MAENNAAAGKVEEKPATGRGTFCFPKNEEGTADIYGRKFTLPVDAEHKAVVFNFSCMLFSFKKPHMRAFHTSWFNFFAGFVSTFAAAPLKPYMKKQDSLNLSKSNLSAGNVASVAGTIVLRSIMGPVMDVFGARKGMFVLMALCTPGVIGMIFTSEATGYIICRCLIGFSLATFVCSQTWCAQMFNKNIVGIANATAAGWGNLGGGITNLTMPLFFLAFMSGTEQDEDLSWRLTYLIPLLCHLIAMGMSAVSQDLPDGNYGELENSGVKQKSKGSAVLKIGLSNVNAWIVTLTYGACFGVELTMNNIASGYFTSYHGLTPAMSGLFASFFGLMNICARSIGGAISDKSNKHFGMRGRLWSTWIIQSLEGALCIVLGLITSGMKSPYEHEDDSPSGCTSEDSACILGWAQKDGNWIQITGTKTKVSGNWANKSSAIPFCGGLSATPDDNMQALHGFDDKQVMLLTPPSKFAQRLTYINKQDQMDYGDDCISNQNMTAICLFVMILFSIFVQAAEGLSYGVVPYISRPALGVVSGMVGAGGSLGSVITLAIFFSGGFRDDLGLAYMGIYIIGITSLLFFVYFPDMGGMLMKKGTLGKYDPQLIAPPKGYRGADSMDFANLNTETKNKEMTAPKDVTIKSEGI